jgi:tetratricopeptide (TPR) repeat protein
LTNGNPFFIGELLAHLDEVGSIRPEAGGWISSAGLDAAGVPMGLRGVIGRRLAQLDDRCRRALDIAAVCGLSFGDRTVAGVSGDAYVHEALDDVAATGLLREQGAGRYEFAHALVRQRVLDDLSRTALARLHWSIGEQLEREGDANRVVEIAEHFACAGDIGEATTIVRTSLAAGVHALESLAFDEAVGHLRAALAHAGRSKEGEEARFRILTSLGRALNALADEDGALVVWLDAATIAEQMRDPHRVLEALVGLVHFNRFTTERHELRLLDVILELSGPDDSAARAQALAWRAARSSRATGAVVKSQVDDAVAMARRVGDLGALASTLRARQAIQAQGPDAAAVLRDAEEMLQLRDRVGDYPIDPSTRHRDMARALLRLGRRKEAEALIALDEVEAASSGVRMAQHGVLLMQSAIATAAGDFADGDRLATKAAQRSDPNVMSVAMARAAQRLAMEMELGRPQQIVSTIGSVPSGVTIPAAWQALLIGAHAELGDEAIAASLLEGFSSHLESGLSYLFGAPLAIRYIAETCRQLGDAERAARLLPHVERWSGVLLVVNTSIEGAADRSVGHLLATLGRFEAADAAYKAAAELERASKYWPLAARSDYWRARALLERNTDGDAVRAQMLLNVVCDVADRLGMQRLAAQARTLAGRPAATGPT